jgi:CDP-glucose 4,6-dehydratase
MENVSLKFWQGKRVLLTGHTGFKGSWLTLWLEGLGAIVTGIALPPSTEPNLFMLAQNNRRCKSFFCDIRDPIAIEEIFQSTKPDVVFHLAAQALVRSSYVDPVGTFSINTMGTVHILEAIRKTPEVRVAVMVTTDKVYRNNEWCWPYREEDPLGGYDPYSASKAASEIIISSYRDSFLAGQGIAIASARAGNVIGGGDWSEDRLIPDAVRAWQSKRVLEIRSPHSIRPWQHVLEPLSGYLLLAQKLWERPNLAGAYNFGPESSEVASVSEVVDHAREFYGVGEVSYSDKNFGPHEADTLSLEIAKSSSMLSYRPRWNLVEAIRRTIGWYLAQNSGKDAAKLCLKDIDSFITFKNKDVRGS